MDKSVSEVPRDLPKKMHARRLTFYHPNTKGAGAAVQFELRLNREGEERYDCFFLEMAHQKPVEEGDLRSRGPASFDWGKKITVKLDFLDVCELLLVLEGRKEQAGDGRNGIYHAANGANTLISLKKSSEGGGCYLGLSRKAQDGSQLFRGNLLLSEAECVGLRCVFQSGLFIMTFGSSGVPPI